MAGRSDLGIEGLVEVEEVGRGGFGVVYRARQPAYQRTVAVKLLSLIGASDARARFERERQTIGALTGHPNVVTVYESGYADDGTPFILMEFLNGGSLAQQLRDGPMPWEDAVSIVVRIAGALQAAHQLGILHRDVKPENVLVSAYGEPKLADFGIASLASTESTRSGSLTASVAHAAPELFDGVRASVASDIYALGSTLFTLLAQGPAFRVGSSDSLLGVIGRITRDPVPDLRLQDVPDAVASAVERAMEKRPEARPQSAAAFADELRAAEVTLGRDATAMVATPPDDRSIEWQTSSVPIPITPVEPPRRDVHRRRRRLLQVGIPLVLVGLLAGAVAVASASQDDPEESIAATATTRRTTSTVTTTTALSTTGPMLVISAPQYDEKVHSPAITFAGTTAPGATLQMVGVSDTIDGPPVGGPIAVTVDPTSGAWSTQVLLNPGTNVVTFEARDAAGHATTKKSTAIYEAPASSGGSRSGSRGSASGGSAAGGTGSSGATAGGTGAATEGGAAAEGGAVTESDGPPTDSAGTSAASGGAEPTGTDAPAATEPPPSGDPNQNPVQAPPSGTGTPGPSGQPTAGDDNFYVNYYDQYTYQSSDGSWWWAFPVGYNDTSTGTAIQFAALDESSYYGSQLAVVPTLCGDGYLCVWYHQLCDGTYTDAFNYAIKDADSGLTDTATVYVHVSYNRDANYADDCTG